MDTITTPVNGIRFTPDGQAEVLGRSRLAHLVEVHEREEDERSMVVWDEDEGDEGDDFFPS